MSHSSQKTTASIVAGILLIIAYVIYALGESAPDPENVKAWAVAMLVFIGIGAAVTIVVEVLFHVALVVGIAVKEGEQDEKKIERAVSSSMVEDEREKLIGLKSSHVGYLCAGAGSVAMLAALASGLPFIPALHILFGAFALGSVAEGAARVYFYEKGVRNG